jgi:hypothetical protein
MPLTVEDGTLVAGADSYVSLDDADAFWADNGAPTAWTALTDEAKDGRLRAAARYLQDGQRLPFTGAPHTWDQALVWPRLGALNFGIPVPSDAIPPQVIGAQLWLTVYGYASGAIAGTPATAATNGNLRSQQLGPIARSFFSPKEMAEGQAMASNAAPADLVGMLYGLLDQGLLPLPGVIERRAPSMGAGQVEPVCLDDTTRALRYPLWWP